eukprot:5436975-Prymnesium_polylepis.2
MSESPIVGGGASRVRAHSPVLPRLLTSWRPTPRGAADFVTMECGGDGTLARLVLAELLERNVFVRMPGAAPLDRCIRVSVSSDADLEVFRAALGPALDAARRRSEPL